MEKETTTQLLLNFGFDGETLVPVVIQERASLEVLILAFTNRIAFDKSRETGYVTLWSRSRNELWVKGATSGDKLKINEIRINCEQNSLLYLVSLEGEGACHAKNDDGSSRKSCYYRSIEPDDTLRFQ